MGCPGGDEDGVAGTLDDGVALDAVLGVQTAAQVRVEVLTNIY